MCILCEAMKLGADPEEMKTLVTEYCLVPAKEIAPEFIRATKEYLDVIGMKCKISVVIEVIAEGELFNMHKVGSDGNRNPISVCTEHGLPTLIEVLQDAQKEVAEGSSTISVEAAPEYKWKEFERH